MQITKLDSAMEMLNSGEFLVKEVAFKIGYQNPSHFISAFKKKFGYTPKAVFQEGSCFNFVGAKFSNQYSVFSNQYSVIGNQ
jgi:AraC-like DNA-binding protein